MNRRLRRALTWTLAGLALPAAVAAAPVPPPASPGWEPEIVVVGEAPPPVNAHLVRAVRAPAAGARRALPPGVGSERGLQVKTILAKRAICAKFPQITEISGFRPDPMKWHPNGLAVDFAIPDYDTPAGKALGDRITEFALANAERFSLEYVIWQRMYIPAKGKPKLMADAGNDDANHFTHVHISTYGGGFPTGGERYFE